MKSLFKLAAVAALSCGILTSAYASFAAALSAPGSLAGNITVPSTASVVESCGTSAPGAVTVSGPLGSYNESPQVLQHFQSIYVTGNVAAGTYAYAVTEYYGGYTVISFSW